MVLQQWSSFVNFLIYLVVSIPLLLIGIKIFMWQTPYNEMEVIKDAACCDTSVKDEAGTAVAQHRLVGCEARAEVVDIGLAHRRFGAEDADHAALRQFGGGLDRGDGADDRQVERGANVRERDRRGGVARDHREPRLIALDEPPEQRGNARREFRVALFAIGQTGIVGGVDHRRGRQQRARRAEDGEAAEAAVEEEDGGVRGRVCHRRRLAGGGAVLNQ